ncbi:MAG: DNA polymerase II large subunit, partial [Thermoplasmata archaeon]|nr:DNA polymerase II large subunit [Thermoplasmata archaeon]
MAVATSKEMSAYFQQLQDEANRCYEVAREARTKGIDPELDVEIPQADDLASRVEMLLELEGIADVIREAAKKHPNREVMSIVVAKKVANEYKGSKAEALDKAVRVGLAVLTEGILVAPLDGIAEVKIHGEGDTSYASISFAGPIRSAGGTGQAMSVLIADVVRSELGIGPYEATTQEIERWKEEIPLYRRLVNLQYLPSEEEIEAIIKGCKVCVDGEGTEEAEISGYRDLPRMESNRVRGGACLVVAEGLALKAKKLNKHVKKLKIDNWDFLKVMVKEDKSDDGGKTKGVEPNFKFIKDMVAGRPVYSHPSSKGGFRLRYGRSRTAGLASISIHPAIMYIVQETLAIGTQIKIERPGKAGISTPCDMLEGPLLLMKNGNLVRVKTAEQAKKISIEDIEKIVELGEILIPVGEFIENNHPLVPAVFDIGWYTAILEDRKITVKDIQNMSLEESLKLVKKHDIPLHPNHTFAWNNLTVEEINELREVLIEKGEIKDKKVQLPDTEITRHAFMELGIPYIVSNNNLILENAEALYPSLGIVPDGKIGKLPKGNFENTLDYVSKLASFKILDRLGTLIGARMARPEKAAVRKMKPPVHGLFPVGTAGGPQRLLSKAAEGTGKYKIALGVRKCMDCGETGFLPLCECGGHTIPTKRVEEQTVDAYWTIRHSREKLKLSQMPKVKGVQGMISKNKTPEMPEKAVLRAKHDVFVFKDGTSRFDCTDAPLTHFKPKEIDTSIEKLKELGYEKDIHGKPLKNDCQIVEMRSQDIVLPDNGGDYFLQVSHFIDELLVSLYGMKPFYNARKRQDLIGAGLLGLSPHTSGGVLSRLIGFTRARVGYAHPFFHAAKRRNCDGDEDCFMLLMDGLLNFSVSYLPEKRG